MQELATDRISNTNDHSSHSGSRNTLAIMCRMNISVVYPLGFVLLFTLGSIVGGVMGHRQVWTLHYTIQTTLYSLLLRIFIPDCRSIIYTISSRFTQFPRKKRT
ncbi:putative transmembrane protein [Toxoplasma gondii RUB]|uniref:Putative transmembrane protein n=1 Tax=Toxoplasma gondii RUB TaxID=935652 RepID=A0A086LWN8_TOXGO|nr:putative transmembrane protein [Toxoplasma gondii RUB]